HLRVALLGVGFAALTAATAAPARASCNTIAFERAQFTVCRFDVEDVAIEIHWRGDNARPFTTLNAVTRALSAKGDRILMAMNAGMYHEDLSPVGYHVEDRRKLKAANTRRGPGNFHLLPNGIFFVDKGRVGVMETRAFLRRNRRPEFATQSGPMLVIDGKLHPKFRSTSQSRKRRNGVGVSQDGRAVVFVLSNQPVTFHAFARLFRDQLKTPNALFLDGGSVPQMVAPGISRLSFAPVGPVVSVTSKSQARSKSKRASTTR
ncbi:MAG: phosphodiester glycosidase family protein, partial [Pseudomonadota bacterium]